MEVLCVCALLWRGVIPRFLRVEWLTRDITMVLNLPQIREEGDPHCHTFPHHDGKYVHSKTWVADLRQRFNAAVDALDNDGE